MKIDPGIAARQWEQAAVEQLALDMTREGYDIERETRVRGIEVDLLASRGEEKILFEVKAPGAADSAAWVPSVAKVQALAKDLGARFRLVVVRVPHETSIHIKGLESALRTYLVEHTPGPIRALSYDAAILEVEGVLLTELTYENGFDLAGTGDVVISLPTRSLEVNLPFSFAAAFALVSVPKHVESMESVVIQGGGRVRRLLRACGRSRTGVAMSAAGCVIPAI